MEFAESRRYRILLVDDDARALESLGAALADDLDVSVASSPGRALELFERDSFEVVCSDYQMSGMNGLDLLHAVTRRSPHVGCVLITGSPDYMSARAQDSHYVFVKPLDPSRLIRMVLQLARVCRMKRAFAVPDARRAAY